MAGGSSGTGGGISAGVAGGVEALRLSAPPLSNRGLARTLHLWVVPRAEAIVWSVLITRLSAVVLPVGVKSSFGETRSSLVVMNPWLLGRPADASVTGDLQ